MPYVSEGEWQGYYLTVGVLCYLLGSVLFLSAVFLNALGIAKVQGTRWAAAEQERKRQHSRTLTIAAWALWCSFFAALCPCVGSVLFFPAWTKAGAGVVQALPPMGEPNSQILDGAMSGADGDVSTWKITTVGTSIFLVGNCFSIVSCCVTVGLSFHKDYVEREGVDQELGQLVDKVTIVGGAAGAQLYGNILNTRK